MYLIVGLGNPGQKYDNTRHNFGQRVLDFLAGTQSWKTKQNYHHTIKLDDIILAKPDTYMNESGKAIHDLLKYYPEAELILVHDELDLPLGSLKIQKDISSAGHNGVKSVIDLTGTQDFIRIRLGIDDPEVRGRMPGEDFVLQKFTTDEEQIVKEVLEKAKDAIDLIQREGLEIAQSKYNG
jgi:PTH1 family peptidyl-tRNA hydrolase